MTISMPWKSLSEYAVAMGGHHWALPRHRVIQKSKRPDARFGEPVLKLLAAERVVILNEEGVEVNVAFRDIDAGHDQQAEALGHRPRDFVGTRQIGRDVLLERAVVVMIGDRHDVKIFAPGFGDTHRGPDEAVGEDRVHVQIGLQDMEFPGFRHRPVMADHLGGQQRGGQPK